MKSQRSKPWLTSTGVEIPTEQLRQICKTWNQETWEEYLNWYESPRIENLIPQEIYDDLTECEHLTVFEKAGQSVSEDDRRLCNRLLTTLPIREAKILRLTFLEGRTVREIAALERIPKSSVHDLKNRALLRLRRGHHGDGSDTCRFMRGECSADENSSESVWDRSSPYSIKEARVYDPAEQNEALEEIQHPSLKVAIRELSERQKRIIYMRFWCDFSVNEIASDLKCGVNLVDQLLDATISGLKRKVLAMELGNSTEGGPSCA